MQLSHQSARARALVFCECCAVCHEVSSQSARGPFASAVQACHEVSSQSARASTLVQQDVV